MSISEQTLNKLSTKDLEYFVAGKMDKMSTSGLEMIAAEENNAPIIAPTVEVGAKVPYSVGAETARAGLKGLSLSFSDEIEAALRSGAISGQEYEAIRDELRAKQEAFARENPKTALAAEVAGGLATPMGIFGTAAKAPSILKTSIIGTGLGGVQGAGQSTNPEDLGKDIFTGAQLGGLTTLGLGTIGAAVAPKIQKGSTLLQEEGVPATLGSAYGGSTQAIEQASESIPLIGQLVSGARRQQFEAFNRAAFNRALKEIDPNVKVPVDMPLRDAANFTYSQISNKYTELYPKIKLTYNKTLDKQFNALSKKHSDLGDKSEQFKTTLTNIQNRLKDKSLSGGQIKALKEDLRTLTDAYRGSTGSEKLLGDAYNDLENSIMMSVRNQNPKLAKELKQTDTAYATYKKVENAAASAKGGEGVFTPAQLETAIKQGNKSQYARGKALLQDLSNAGYDVLGNKVPDSGTTSRAGLATLATTGAGFLNPKAIIPTAVASGLYTPFGMKYITPLLTTQRPSVVDKYGTKVRAALPFGVGASDPLLQSLLGGQ
jgi:hypothetical protein